jgi:hypothetical protein
MYRRPVGRNRLPAFVRTRGGTTSRPRGGQFRTTYRQPPQEEIYEDEGGDESYEHDEFGSYGYDRSQYTSADYEDDGDEYEEDEQVEEEDDEDIEEDEEDVSLLLSTIPSCNTNKQYEIPPIRFCVNACVPMKN